MKVLKIIGVLILAIVVVFGAVVAFQPSQGHVEKSTVINAPPSAVYKAVNSFKDFTVWSPWSKMDPGAKYTFEGSESGVGAKMSWESKKIGTGSQWIAESEENKRVKNGLAFGGFDGTSFAEFVLTPEGNGTKITWTYDGANPGITGKAMWVFMKGALATQYEQGLNDLKKMVESTPAVPATSDTTKVAPSVK